jgi:hypothetical protein
MPDVEALEADIASLQSERDETHGRLRREILAKQAQLEVARAQANLDAAVAVAEERTQALGLDPATPKG